MRPKSDAPRGLTAVPTRAPSLGDSVQALAHTDWDAFDRIVRPHAQPDFPASVERDLARARELLFGEDPALTGERVS